MSTFRQLLEVIENTCKPYIGKVNYNAYRNIGYGIERNLEQAGITLPPEVKSVMGGLIVELDGLGQSELVSYHVEFKRDGRSRYHQMTTGKVLDITVESKIKEEFFDSEIGDIVQMIAYSIMKDVHVKILEDIGRLEKELEEYKKDAARLEQDLKNTEWDKDVLAPDR